jgi:hypothetical protein
MTLVKVEQRCFRRELCRVDGIDDPSFIMTPKPANLVLSHVPVWHRSNFLSVFLQRGIFLLC